MVRRGVSRAPRVVAAVVDRVRVASRTTRRGSNRRVDRRREVRGATGEPGPTDGPTDARGRRARDGARRRGRRRVAGASARAYVFDLDGTLYAIANGYEAACRRRVYEFMATRCAGVDDVAEARVVWEKWFKRYNQTLRALRSGAGYEFDAAEYWRFTRGDAREHLAPSADVRAFVESLPGGRENKYVFTNCQRDAGAGGAGGARVARLFRGPRLRRGRHGRVLQTRTRGV